MYTNILISHNNEITTIFINRPSSFNMIDSPTIRELHHALNEINESLSARVIILTGQGKKVFSTGADITEIVHFSQEEGGEFAANGQKLLFDFIANLSIPVIAAVNGFAIGGGLELAMAAHIRIASSNAKMGLPEVSLGITPGYGGTQRLPQLVGKGKAMEMILTAEIIHADKALLYGLVNHVVTQEELLPFAEKIATKIIKNSPLAITGVIRAINDGYINTANGYKTEIKRFSECMQTEDFKKGTTAYLNNRKTDFSIKQ